MEPAFLVVDLFCGAGGVTTGFALSGVAKVIACVNHDHVAILSHWANHPEVKHFEEDITKLELGPMVAVVKEQQALYPDARLILWASLECTNFSKAKGGLARDADSRTLADHLHRYVTAIEPDYVMIENVVEFLDWGPLRPKIKDGKPVMIKNKHGETVQGYEPVPELKGVDFKRWSGEMCDHGYTAVWRKLNSADFGAYTARERLFGMFSRTAEDNVWPEPTHSKKGLRGLVRWNAVKEKIDFTDEGYDVLHRGTNMGIPPRQRKDISDNTIDRVFMGCVKHIAGGKEAFLIKYHGGVPRTNDMEKPLTVIDTENRHAACFITKYFSGKPYGKNISVEGPAGTIKTSDGQALVQAFMSMYHGNGDNTHSVDAPAPVIAAADISAVCFLHRAFSGGGESSSINDPAGSIMIEPKLDLITVKGNYLLSLQYGGQMSGVDKPAPTLLATGDKTPVYLVITEGGAAIRIFDTDSESVRRLKVFMAMYGIGCIKMRMLRTDELLQIQGFPKSFRLAGTQSDQKKFIGNSVVPDVVKAWALAMAEAVRQAHDDKKNVA